MGPSAIRYAGLDPRIEGLGRHCEDWGNVETLAAHKRARETLAGLLERWEALFEAQTERA